VRVFNLNILLHNPCHRCHCTYQQPTHSWLLANADAKMVLNGLASLAWDQLADS